MIRARGSIGREVLRLLVCIGVVMVADSAVRRCGLVSVEDSWRIRWQHSSLTVPKHRRIRHEYGVIENAGLRTGYAVVVIMLCRNMIQP